MVVFMLYDTSSHSLEGFFMFLEILIQVPDGEFRFPRNILPDGRDAQAAFLIFPWIAPFVNYLRIDEGLLETLWLNILDRGAVNYKKPYRKTYLRGCKPDAMTVVHGFVHIL